jgi:hypothetical protein
VQDIFFAMLQATRPELALEVLEFGLSHTGDTLDFSLLSLIAVLDISFPHLRAVGFHDMYGDLDGCADLDDALVAHTSEMGQKLHISDETAEFEVGTYYFD